LMMQVPVPQHLGSSLMVAPSYKSEISNWLGGGLQFGDH